MKKLGKELEFISFVRRDGSGDCLNAGNKPVLEILNPSMIRKKVVIN